MATRPVSTVKARRHVGATSLDLTIPSELCSRFEIKAGDVFAVGVSREDGRTVLTYTRVFPTE